MKTKQTASADTFADPDDAPEWTEDQLARAEFAVNGEVIRPAQGTLTRKPGRPRVAEPKQIVSLRLEPDVIEAYRATGAGWQKRMGEVLKAGVGREASTGRYTIVKSDTGALKGAARDSQNGAFTSSATGKPKPRSKTAS